MAEEHTIAPVHTSEYWSKRYETGETGWDMGGEVAVFRDLREGELLRTLGFDLREEKTKVLVPGCGYGHDALRWAAAGFPTTAVDFAAEPLEVASRKAAEEGVMTFTPLQKDVFTLATDYPASFDIVLEYTCYCAIAPAKREEYAQVMSAVLRQGGLFVGLFFPIGGSNTTQPPFGVAEEEIAEHFTLAGMELLHSAPHHLSHPARADKEKVFIFTKK